MLGSLLSGRWMSPSRTRLLSSGAKAVRTETCHQYEICSFGANRHRLRDVFTTAHVGRHMMIIVVTATHPHREL
jgi:hypothetical protein